MKQGEVLPIIWTIDDDSIPDLNTCDEIIVVVLVNMVPQLTFKKTEANAKLLVTIDGTQLNKCLANVLPEQSATWPVGRITSEISIIQNDEVVNKAEVIVDYCYPSYTL
jgi:hypothetical protein